MNEDQKKRIKQALDIIGEVQIEMTKEWDLSSAKKENQDWRDLYWIRIKLGEFLHYGHVLGRM